MIREAAPMSSGGTVISRKPTRRVTKRNKLTATLRIQRRARLLLRKAFLVIKPAVVIKKLFGDQFALFEVDRSGPEIGRLGIVCHHDNRLARIAVKRLQNAEDILGGLGVEIAGGLISHD